MTEISGDGQAPTVPSLRDSRNLTAKLDGQASLFSKPIIDAVFFNRDSPDNIYLEPDLVSIQFLDEKPIGEGTGFTVFQVDSPNGKKVAKVERVILRKDPETGAWSTHYPWMSLGLGQERTGLYTPTDAVERRDAHLQIQRRLESVGIETTKYVGSLVIPSKPLANSEAPFLEVNKTADTTGDDAATQADFLMKQVRKAGRPPLYAEVWEHPGGKMFGPDEILVENIYKTPQGREQLRHLAMSLIELSKQGYLYDVDQFYEETGTFTSARTEIGYPYPRNFFVVNAETPDKMKFVAVDFNMGVDLTKMPWWTDEFKVKFETMDLTQRSEGKLYVNGELEGQMDEAVRSRFVDLTEREKKRLNSNDEYVGIKQRIDGERILLEAQVNHFCGQIQVAVAILRKLEETEKPPSVGSSSNSRVQG